MPLKPPLYALLIAPDKKMRDAILDGKKKITIREGHRDYPVGQKVMLCCNLVPWAVMATITNVRHCTLQEVTRGELYAEGFSSHEELLRDLRQYYPNISSSSPITIIGWDDPAGTLINIRARKYQHSIQEHDVVRMPGNIPGIVTYLEYHAGGNALVVKVYPLTSWPKRLWLTLRGKTIFWNQEINKLELVQRIVW